MSACEDCVDLVYCFHAAGEIVVIMTRGGIYISVVTDGVTF